MVGNNLCNAFPIVLLKYNCFIYIFFILVWNNSIVELMGILCFDWNIFMYIARRRNYMLMMFVGPLLGFEFAELICC